MTKNWTVNLVFFPYTGHNANRKHAPEIYPAMNQDSSYFSLIIFMVILIQVHNFQPYLEIVYSKNRGTCSPVRQDCKKKVVFANPKQQESVPRYLGNQGLEAKSLLWYLLHNF